MSRISLMVLVVLILVMTQVVWTRDSITVACASGGVEAETARGGSYDCQQVLPAGFCFGFFADSCERKEDCDIYEDPETGISDFICGTLETSVRLRYAWIDCETVGPSHVDPSMVFPTQECFFEGVRCSKTVYCDIGCGITVLGAVVCMKDDFKPEVLSPEIETHSPDEYEGCFVDPRAAASVAPKKTTIAYALPSFFILDGGVN